METHTQPHDIKDSLFYGVSILLERASFFGMRAIIILYMIGEVLLMDRAEALKIYGWLIGIIVFSKVLGGVIGDLVLGNRTTVIVGGIMQALGCFALCVPSVLGLYLGLGLITLGTGLHGPNAMAQFGKGFLGNAKKMDAGYTGIYVAINIFVALGVLAIGFVGERRGFQLGFAITGVLALLSALTTLFTTTKKTKWPSLPGSGMMPRIIYIFIAMVGIGLFWSLYDSGASSLFDIAYRFEGVMEMNIALEMFTNYITWIGVVFGIILTAVLYFVNIPPLIKFGIGFLFAVICFLLMFTIPDFVEQGHIVIFILALLFVSLAELFVAPTIYTAVTKAGNPKYLAILFGAMFLPAKLFSWLFGIIQGDVLDYDPNKILVMVFVFFALMGAAFMVLGLLKKTIGLDFKD